MSHVSGIPLLRWASALRELLVSPSEDLTPCHQRLQSLAAGVISLASLATNSNANTTREFDSLVLTSPIQVTACVGPEKVSLLCAPVWLYSCMPQSTITFFTVSFRLHSRPPLSKEFEVSLKNLPSTYDHKNTSAFRQFISIYGTHFIRRVQLGGRVHSMTAIRTCQTSMSGLSIQAVSTCLSAEASATIKGIPVHASSEFCRRKSKSLKTASTFSAAFSDRKTQVLGGDGGITDILFNPRGSEGYKKWLASLKSVPGVVSYQISPLHLLVRNKWRVNWADKVIISL